MSKGISRSPLIVGAPCRAGAYGIAAALMGACLWLAACGRTATTGPAAPAAAASKSAADVGPKSATEAKEGLEGVTLTAEQIEKLGVETQAAQAADHNEEVAGYGVILSHEIVAQATAELVTARATERLSRSELARAQKLTGTAGAVSVDIEETAAQKAAIDAAALTLTTRKFSSVLGMNPPWKAEDPPLLHDVASGKIKLVRVTFPLGALAGGTPTRLRATRIGGANPAVGWKMSAIWDAPADVNVPGRNFFALLKDGDAGEGERLRVFTPIGAAESGFLIPASAAVMSEGKYWCYVEKKPGVFGRIEIDTSKPSGDGYFVTEGVSAGDKVVTAAAGQLLAKETSSSAEPD